MVETYGGWLKRRLEAEGMSMRSLSRVTGVDHSTISRIVAGRDPMYSTARALAKVVGWPHSRGAHI